VFSFYHLLLKKVSGREGIIVPSLQQNGNWGLVLRAGLLAQISVGELIPSSVRDLIRSQLARLTPTAWELLVAGAALGQGLTFERLIQVAQLDEQEGLRVLEELLRNGLLCEGKLLEDSQAVDGYVFPREMFREVVYQEAGTTRQRLVQRRVLLVMQEEEALPFHPVPDNEYASAETRNGQGRRVVARAVGGDRYWAVAKDSSGATRRHAGIGMGEQTLLTLRGARGQYASDFPRSPPGRPFQSFFPDALKRREITMVNQQQLDLLKQGVATAWNTWRDEHPDTPIRLSGVDLSEANLGEVNLAGADLSRANLSRADLNTANLSQARLAQADLSGANLAGSDLSDADLSEANLSHADLNGADLTGANLQGADVREALLEEATLEGALITSEQLSQAKVGHVGL